MKSIFTIIRHDLTHAKGVGDIVHVVVKPIAKVINSPCLDKDGNLIPDSPCGKKVTSLNKKFPFNK